MIKVSLEFLDLKSAEKYLKHLEPCATRKYYKFQTFSNTSDDKLFDLTLYVIEERPSGLTFLHEITFQERVGEDKLADVMNELGSKGFYQALEWRDEV